MTCTHTTGRPPSRGARRVGLVVCAAVAVVTLVAGCGDDSASSTSPAAPDRSTSIPGLPGIDPLPCDPATALPGETVTRDRGGPDSGISVVAEYHWAVITARDSAQAADAIAPGNAMARPDLIAEALNGFPPGTTYCLRLRQTKPDTVLFTLTYQPPTGATAEYLMRASVTGTAGSMRMTGEVEQ